MSDTKHCLTRASIDIIAAVGLGLEMKCLENADSSLVKAHSQALRFGCVSPDRIGSQMHMLLNLLPGTRSWFGRKAHAQGPRQTILEHITPVVEGKGSNIQSNQNVIFSLASYERTLRGAGEITIDDEATPNQVVTLFGAGSDLIAIAVSWALHLLSMNQHVQPRLREEIRSPFPVLFNHENVDFAGIDVDSLPCMDNVCHESLRLMPPVPVSGCQVLEDDWIGEYLIPKGTVVLFTSPPSIASVTTGALLVMSLIQTGGILSRKHVKIQHLSHSLMGP